MADDIKEREPQSGPSDAPAPAIDLKTVGAAPSGDGGPPHPPVGPPEKGTAVGVSPYSLDQTRRYIAFILLAVLAAIVAAWVLGAAIAATACWSSTSVNSTTGIAACPQAQASLGLLTGAVGTVFTAMIGLVGSVVGFYFGSQRQN